MDNKKQKIISYIESIEEPQKLELLCKLFESCLKKEKIQSFADQSNRLHLIEL